MENLRNSLSPATQRKMGDKALPAQEKNSRDQLLAAIRSSNLKQLKKVGTPGHGARLGGGPALPPGHLSVLPGASSSPSPMFLPQVEKHLQTLPQSLPIPQTHMAFVLEGF